MSQNNVAHDIAGEIIGDIEMTLDRRAIRERIQNAIDKETAELRQQLQAERDCVLRQQREINHLRSRAYDVTM